MNPTMALPQTAPMRPNINIKQVAMALIVLDVVREWQIEILTEYKVKLWVLWI